MEITISYFDKEDNEKEISVTVDISAYFDGIGPYEYWGCKGYDKGQLCIDINSVCYDKEGLPQDEIEEIEKKLKSREFQERIYEKYLDDKQSAREDAAEAAYEARMENNY